ncbi:MAG TPA: hypothetical protein ENG22_05235 [Candidatus Bathyarchaeota archaeon]|nr:hypothetical protein [Candidatus Bathyarchaeota archaeon]
MKVKPKCYVAAARIAPLKNEVEVQPAPPHVGDLIAVKVTGKTGVYTYVENHVGEKVNLYPGDIFVAVIGYKKSTVNIVGEPPEKLDPGCKIYLLTFGGLVGNVVDVAYGLEYPLELEYIGSLVDDGEIANLKRYRRIEWRDNLGKTAPVILVIGSSAESGKSTAVGNIVKALVKRGYKVAGVKLSGVAALRDHLRMKNAGADPVYDFVDAGLPSTYTDPKTVLSVAKGILYKANESRPDVIVAEMGGNLLGYRTVVPILLDREIMGNVTSIVLAASDALAAYGGVHIAREHYGIEIDLVTGPATDTVTGLKLIERYIGVKAMNLQNPANAEKITDYLLEKRVKRPRVSEFVKEILRKVPELRS